jgi:branched-chain amino acid transport system permease protein
MSANSGGDRTDASPGRGDSAPDDEVDTEPAAGEVATDADGDGDTGTDTDRTPDGPSPRPDGGAVEEEPVADATVGPLVDRLWRYRVPLGLVALVVLLRPVVAHPWFLGFEQIATTMLVWMLFVAAWNLLFGFTGLLSFGHAMFFGFGMYGVAVAMSRLDLPFLAGAVGGVLLAAVVGNLLGRLIVEKGEIYFAMLTLAVGQAVFFVVNRDPYGLTGGSNGITGETLPPWVETFRGEKTLTVLPSFANDFYYLVAVVFLLCMLGLWQLLRSPFGRTLIAIRENEPLASAMGVDTTRYKVASFTVSGALAAVAGVLLELNDGAASLATFGVLTSGDAVLMAILGGVHYFFGPVTGVFVWFAAEDYLTDFTLLQLPLAEFPLVAVDVSGVLQFWRFGLGAIFVLVVLLSPTDGVYGLVRERVVRAYRRLRGADE